MGILALWYSAYRAYLQSACVHYTGFGIHGVLHAVWLSVCAQGEEGKYQRADYRIKELAMKRKVLDIC